MKNHKNFNRAILIADKQFAFYNNEKKTEKIVVYITPKGYCYFLATVNKNKIIKKEMNLSLDKLNSILPVDMQLTKNHIIYLLLYEEEIQ